MWSVFLWLGSGANEGWFQLSMGESNIIPDNGEFRRNDAYNNQPSKATKTLERFAVK